MKRWRNLLQKETRQNFGKKRTKRNRDKHLFYKKVKSNDYKKAH